MQDENQGKEIVSQVIEAEVVDAEVVHHPGENSHTRPQKPAPSGSPIARFIKSAVLAVFSVAAGILSVVFFASVLIFVIPLILLIIAAVMLFGRKGGSKVFVFRGGPRR